MPQKGPTWCRDVKGLKKWRARWTKASTRWTSRRSVRDLSRTLSCCYLTQPKRLWQTTLKAQDWRKNMLNSEGQAFDSPLIFGLRAVQTHPNSGFQLMLSRTWWKTFAKRTKGMQLGTSPHFGCGDVPLRNRFINFMQFLYFGYVGFTGSLGFVGNGRIQRRGWRCGKVEPWTSANILGRCLSTNPFKDTSQIWVSLKLNT